MQKKLWKISMEKKNFFSNDNTPLYLAFVVETPNVINPWTNSPPSGLNLLQDIIDDNEEKLLMALFENNTNNSGKLKNRSVKHFGFEFDYDNNKIKYDPLDDPIQSQTDFLFERLENKFNIKFKPDQLTINNYNPGQGIPLHVDTHSIFGDVILCLSLGSGIVMDFRNIDNTHVSIYLPNKSLLVLDGESRYAWRHGIISIEIATHFSETRHKAWPKVSNFIHSLPVGSILIDIGCGNGKYLGQNKNIFQLGCERSENLAKICQERNLSIFQADCLGLPLLSEYADACISIAVYHHLVTQERRIKAIDEMIRILRPGGKGLIYV